MIVIASPQNGQCTRLSGNQLFIAKAAVSRLQAHTRPLADDKSVIVGALERAFPARPIVNAIGALEPQFDTAWPHPNAAPVWRPRDDRAMSALRDSSGALWSEPQAPS